VTKTEQEELVLRPQDAARFSMVSTLRTPLGLKGHRPAVGTLDCEALISVCGALNPLTSRLTTRLVERRNADARG
jgi:hypothetical protein